MRDAEKLFTVIRASLNLEEWPRQVIEFSVKTLKNGSVYDLV